MNFLISFLLLQILAVTLIHAQQPYIRRANTDCGVTDPSTSILGYACNGNTPTCQSYLIFRSHPPYTSVASIAALLASDPSQIAELNRVATDSSFATNAEVIVPVNCSCMGENNSDTYQADSFYTLGVGETYFSVANDTYQGLSTCHALQTQNNFSTRSLVAGSRITVPLRCACPTANQTAAGVNYLVSYTVTWGDSVFSISSRFGADAGRTLAANEISGDDPTIFPFTTLLVPLQNPPDSQTIIPSPQPPPPPPPPPPASVSPSGNNNNNRIYIIIGVICAVVLVLAASGIIFCVCVRKRKLDKSAVDPIQDSESFQSYEKTNTKSLDESDEFLVSISEIAQSLRLYKFQELQSATDNFSAKCLVKGSIYRGTIDGSQVAIKKTNKDAAVEINILDKINHFNLIKLIGVCFSQGYWYLVYEYAQNGSLTEWIHSDNKSLSWDQRVRIALDVASGLNYLHSYTSPPHVHKDVNASNVLLDSDFRAKIANFSLARSAEGHGGEFALTRHIVGTKGYMAPEYLEDGYVSPKLDVYSFGILMLEILTGAVNGTEQVFLPEALAVVLGEKHPEEKLEGFVDPSLRGDYPVESALLWARLIEKCLRREPAKRPAMGDVVQTLSTISSTSLNWEAVKDVAE